MKPARRLVLLLDGTWNEDAAYNQDTNIVRMRDIIADSLTDLKTVPPTEIDDLDEIDLLSLSARRWNDIDYFFFYERGVGTGPGLNRILGGALGWGLSQNVRRAYRFLSRNYVSGSEIFIFGFSRGAYTARSLVGYLGSAGLLRAECCLPEIEKDAWDYYRTSPNDRLPGMQIKLQRHSHSAEQLRISCLGVFDTVGTLGVPASLFNRFNRSKYEFHDVELSPIVKLNLHALAIDERRLQFEASVWRYNKFRPNNSVTEQVWFPGTHSDIGGGYYSDEERDAPARGLDDVPLDWMLKRLRFHYPTFPVVDGAVVSKFRPILGRLKKAGLLHESRTWRYRITSPAIRAIANIRPPRFREEKRVSYDRDAFMVGESVHISALERIARLTPYKRRGLRQLYLPRNLVELLPDLYSKYCERLDLVYGPDSLSVTSWTGEVVETHVDPNERGPELKEVQDALTAAVARLKVLGYDVTSVSLKSPEAARTLNACKPARLTPWARRLILTRPRRIIRSIRRRGSSIFSS